MKRFGYLLLLLAGYLCTWELFLHWNTPAADTGADEIQIQIQEEQPGFKQKKSPVKEEKTECRTSGQNIRVLITDSQQKGYYHEKIMLKSSGTLYLEGWEQQYRPGEELLLEPENEFLKNGSCHVYTENAGDKIAVNSIRRAYGAPEYEGSFYVQKTDKGLCLINELDLESYLKYVVPSEMPSSYETEALKAQAVCARTYALRQMRENRLEEYGANVDDTVSFQVYNNQISTSETDAAVKETSGQIMTVGEEPIEAYFFSTSCGHTSTDAVWNGKTAESYLQSIYLGEKIDKSLEAEAVFAAFIENPKEESYDFGEPWYRWQVELPLEYLNGRIAPLKIGTLKEIAVKKRRESGIVSKLLLRGSEGEKVLENEYQIRELLQVKGFKVMRNDGSVTERMTMLPSAYFICREVTDESGHVSAYRFIGGGYGHGVGLSQNAANHMAEEGKTWKEILCFFYKDIEVTQI